MQEKKMRPKRSIQGEIVEVEGGRIIRALARKDRHSKVCTAKGPKDRRVRLSATTAIRFYDVQDRLGYDRPSLAIDWLMNEAKPAIDALNADHLVSAMKSNPSNISVSQYFHQNSQELEGYYNNVPNHIYQTGENGIQNQQTNGFESFFNNYQESLNSRNTTYFSAESTHEATEEMVQFQSNGKESAQGFDIDPSLEWRFSHFTDQKHALFTQREPLQSSYLPPVQASVPAPNTSFGIGFTNDGFLGFSFPTRIQGQEEEEEQEKVVSEQLSSASSHLHYQD